MSMNLNINLYGGSSILPVFCGESRGTAFYIGEKRFLTAWHVVSDGSEENGADIIIKYERGDLACRLIALGEMDIALLETDVEIDEIDAIPLLKTEFKEELDLEIIGYPQELGNGLEYFGVRCRNYRKLDHSNDGFDTVVLRTDPFGFHSYSGFSGSPVLNSRGFAVGVVTDQLYNTLGYTSIESVVGELDGQGVAYDDQADQHDDRPYGLLTCQKKVKEAIVRAQCRYNRDLHVEDVDLEERMRYFCSNGIEDRINRFRDKLKKWKDNLPAIYAIVVNTMTYMVNFLNGGNLEDEFYYEMESMLHKKEIEHGDTYFLRGNERSELLALQDELTEMLDYEGFAEKRFLRVTGDAGSGKTYHMCSLAEEISKNYNVYLLLGTDFGANDDPLDTIREKMGWVSNDAFEELNAEMNQSNKYATFIIDALNEGAGTYFWQEKLPQLIMAIAPLNRLKLVVSVRTMETDDDLKKVFGREWAELEITGFNNLRQAITKYFDYFKIRENVENYIEIREFYHPLFLKIFCQAFHSLPFDKRKNIDVPLLYQYFFENRNQEISRGTDEDPQKNVTSGLINKIGLRSLLSHYCCDIPRKEALKMANSLCPNRHWKENLYHNMLKANLLMEYKHRKEQEMFTAFEYEDMGDYVRAKCLNDYNQSDEERLNHLKRMLDGISKQKTLKIPVGRTISTICTFLAVWNPKEEIWHRPEFKTVPFAGLVLQSLKRRHLNKEDSTLKPELISEIVRLYPAIIRPNFIFKNFELYKDSLNGTIHDILMEKRMVERDESWTVYVNQLWDDHSFYMQMAKLEVLNEIEDQKALAQFFCWMLTTSHPQLRFHLMRRLHAILKQHTALCTELVELFYGVNDPYVLQGLYAPVYGVLLTKRNRNLTHNVAKLIFEKYYSEDITVPQELAVRNWTLRILNFNTVMNPEDHYWNDAQPPYVRNDNLMEYPAEEPFDDNYFGEGRGSKWMRTSLFAWDFYRYIIGGNSSVNSHTYIDEDGQGIVLKDIAKACAYRIKEVYKYSETLASYDEKVPYQTRMHNTVERIGKKYQWLALGEIKAYLADTYQVNKNRWGTIKVADIPYPWLDSETITYDPTLMLNGNINNEDKQLFNELHHQYTEGEDEEAWLESKVNYPQPHFVIEDKTHGEWVNIVGTQREYSDANKRETYLFYNSCLVKEENKDAFEQWVNQHNYYVQDHSGQYEFLWNEFPWADTYQQVKEIEVDIRETQGAPCKFQWPFYSQLQEYLDGIEDDEDIKSTVYMPCEGMFSHFGWHTAERGVTRDETGEIVAIHRHIQGDSLDTLVIKRELLDEYLQAKHLVMFYFMHGDKSVNHGGLHMDIQRLCGCWRYVPGGEAIELLPMTDEKDLEQPEMPQSVVLRTPNIDISLWTQLENDEEKQKLLNILEEFRTQQEKISRENKEILEKLESGNQKLEVDVENVTDNV